MGARGTEDESQFEEAALAHLPDLLGSALRLTRDWEEAQALARETLVSAYHSLGNLLPGMDFQTWLLTVMVTTYMGRRRPRGQTEDTTERRLETERADQRPPGAPGQATGGEGQPPERIEVALDALPEELRLPLLLCDIESLSYRDIARALGIPVGAVRARVFLGRQRLQESLAD